jgi:hypothetical protein
MEDLGSSYLRFRASFLARRAAAREKDNASDADSSNSQAPKSQTPSERASSSLVLCAPSRPSAISSPLSSPVMNRFSY